MDLLPLVKQALRVTTTKTDDEISLYIQACLDDLTTSGIDGDQEEPLIKQAVIIYCKKEYGLEAKEDFDRIYYSIKRELALKCGATSVN